MPTGTEAAVAREDLVLEITRVFDAPRELLFTVWSRPEHIVRWWGPEGFRLSHCEMDFRVGGNWRFCMSRPGRDHWIHGTYHEIRRPDRLSFTYINDADGHNMLVEIDFIDLGEQTEMRFRQWEFMNVAERNGHRFGWTSTFDILDSYLKTGNREGD